LTVWPSGETDFQVLRAKDGFVVLNEHRHVHGEAELLAALEPFRMIAVYADHPAALAL
jgi:hypothetical protein